MIRCNKLILGVSLVSVAMMGLMGTPAKAGNWGNGNNPNTVTHLSIGNGYGVNQNFGFQSQNFGYQSNYGQTFRRQIVTTPLTYGVLVKQPNRYGDWNWHEVNTFGSFYRAEQQASVLDSRFGGDYGFAVKVVQHNW